MKRYLIGAAILLSLTLSTQAFGQSSLATISGTVADSTGALIPGVTITVTHEATGQSRQAVTGSEGRFVIPTLLPGTYTVKAELPGFETASDEVRRRFRARKSGQADPGLDAGPLALRQHDHHRPLPRPRP